MAVNRPPPPPPPPPRLPPITSEESDHDDHQSHSSRLSQHHSNHELINNNQTTTIMIRSAIVPGDTIKVLITTDITHDDFAHCIAHAALSPPQIGPLLEEWSNDEGGVANWTRIAGLFRESDGVFIPISLILQNPERYKDDLFHISRFLQPIPKHEIVASSEPKFQVKYILLISAFVAVCSVVMSMALNPIIIMDYIEYSTNWIVNLPARMIENCIDHPLKELYRYGPSVIGWEGTSLEKICTQITHMGDENFWSRNIEECEKIYWNKERAMLHVRKPLVYILLIVAIFFGVQSLVKTWAIRLQNRPHHEMVETYEAFRLMMRVIRRGLVVPTRTSR